MPAGGAVAQGIATTTRNATEGRGLLSRLKDAASEAAQWRPDRNAMGSGFVPLTKKTPKADVPAATTEGATAATTTVSEAPTAVHGNSLQSKKPTHIYKVTKDGEVHKIGESGQGLNAEGQSKRAQQQVRRLNREDTEHTYDSKLLRTYPDKATARKFETQLIEKRKAENPEALPGNKNNR